MNRMIRAVLFDAVGTLFETRGSVGQIYSNVAARHGVRLDAALLERRFQEATRAAGPPVDREGWRRTVREVFGAPSPFARFDPFFEELYATFRSRTAWIEFPETRPVLQALRGRGIPLGVVSNFDSRLGAVLAELDLDAYFDVVVTPYSSGYSKPDPRIFAEATALLDVAAPEVLFVGDHPVQDYAAAIRAGLQAVWIDRRPVPDHGPHVLTDLRGILRMA